MDAGERGRLALVLQRNAELVAAMLRGDAGGRNPLAALAAARTAADALERATLELTAIARADGHTWQEIGELLTITRQAAQQRLGSDGGDRGADAHHALAARATEIVSQVEAEDLAAATADWAEIMFDHDAPARVREAWRGLIADRGALEAIGTGPVVRRGPYRVVDVPVVLAHGPVTIRITFDLDGRVCGFFVLAGAP